MRRIGILGGMFNPPHNGHLALARSAAAELELEQVLLTPTLIPPHKPVEQEPGPKHRLRMCELAVEGDPLLGVCTLELERAGPSYTVDTLRSIDESQPDAVLTLIVGADMARTLASWREPQEIARRIEAVAVAERDHTNRAAVLESLGALGVRGEFLGMDPIDVSSSMVRERALVGEPIEALVSEPVASYIAEHRLYRVEPMGAMGVAGAPA